MNPTSEVTIAQQLYNLPEDVQTELLEIARTAIGMSAAEKGAAAGVFAAVGVHCALEGHDNQIEGAQMIVSLASLLRVSNDHAKSDVREAV